jgi:genome maintenance exonuclease 1
MKRKLFEHKEIDLGYEDLNAETGPNGRKYLAPNGISYPSVTTVLSILSEESIQRWRARVGEEEANKISYRASTRGTAVHAIIEKYLDNDPEFKKDYMPDILGSFGDLQPILDNRIGAIYAQEAALYSDHLGLAGRVDCVAEFDGVLSIVDFKTSRKSKKKEWIEGYFIQESAYAIMWEERTSMPIVNLVTIIAVDNDEPQVFVEHRDNWAPKLLETINEYKRRKMFGH